MAGEIKLNSVNFASESGGTITVNNGTIGSAVAMSANHPAVKTALNASGDAPVYACRAWVNFDATNAFSPNPSTSSIRASGNVSSITDFGTGNYGVNFATAMPDANYSAVRSVALAGNVLIPRGGNTSSSTLEIYVTNTSNTQVDPLEVHVSVFR